MNKTISIAIADDHKLMLDGLATLIESIQHFDLVGKANSGLELIELLGAKDKLPDVVIVDIEMPGMDGVETVKQLRQKYRDLKIMALTMHQESHFVSRMIAAGANAYLLKNVDRETFIRSINRILDSHDFVTEGIAKGPRSSSSENVLTHREKQILKLIADGKSNKEIAEELFISDRTADTHRTNIKRKLKLNTLAQIIQFVKEHSL